MEEAIQWVRELWNQGVATAFTGFVLFFVWKKVIPWLNGYFDSVNKLHDSIGEKIGTQQALCAKHGTAITSHDTAMRRAAIEACSMCRAIAEKELPNSAEMVGKHCDEIERIIGEA
jgi:hypothetical protein